MDIVLAIIVVAIALGFIALYRWTRHVETTEIDWDSQRDAEDRQGQQLGIAMNVNGTFLH